MQLKVKRFDKTLPLPEGEQFEHGEATSQDRDLAAAFDFYCRESVTIPPHEIRLVGVNNAIAVPRGYFCLLFARSSTSWRKGLMIANGVGIIDPFYCGNDDEVKIQLYNITDHPVEVQKGEVLSQGVIIKRETIDWLEVNDMGNDGHGGYETK